MKRISLSVLYLAVTWIAFGQSEVKTTFQTSREWRPTIDNRADAVMVYGVGGNPSDKSKAVSFEDRVQSWREKGYIVHFMTGIAWGEYKDYFTGEWDGKWHLDEGQVTRNGDTLWHGHLVPYLVPSTNFLKYFKEKHVKRAIDAGIDALFFEEPEFWARAGYSEAFKKEWKKYYGFAWSAPHLSPENTWLSSKLKYELYYQALKEVSDYAKEYGKTKGMNVTCYVPTHSLVNYSQWQIVSPEASLASLPGIDGYIAQVWTGTSREPNYYRGLEKERVFETAFLEYGSMASMTAPTGRKMFFLTDPIEDRSQDWEDYRRNYQATFTAQLLFPSVNNFEIMPWPERIYEGLYSVSAGSKQKTKIPQNYATQMQVMINSLNNMPLTDNTVSGSKGVSILMGNSLMFQRFPTHKNYEDPQLSNFYGMALPLLKLGVPTHIAHIENLGYPKTLGDTRVLLMTYSNMKPLDSMAHEHLSRWVHDGGIIIFNGRDDDPFQGVREWWNTNGLDYLTPSAHLFEKLGLGRVPTEGEYEVGKGSLYVMRHDPKEYVLKDKGDRELVEVIKKLYEGDSEERLTFKNHFHLTRGNYELISVMDESVSEEPFTIEGLFIDLFDPALPILGKKVVKPGNQSMLFNISSIGNKKHPRVLASAGRVTAEKRLKNTYSFIVKGPLHTVNVMRVLLPAMPKKCTITDSRGTIVPTGTWEWDDTSNTVFVTFDNDPDGISVSCTY